MVYHLKTLMSVGCLHEVYLACAYSYAGTSARSHSRTTVCACLWRTITCWRSWRRARSFSSAASTTA